jgi:Activator of Hsp90 ATPase homolog 1-like protein
VTIEPNDRAKVSLRVAAKQDLAFRVFTEELDAWWRHGKRYRMGEQSVMRLSAGLGGVLTETVLHGGKERTFEIGRITVWEPPRRLVIEWRAVNFRPRDPSTEVEVTFERAIGHSGEGTLVTLEHRGWSRVRPDHPVRHGQDPRSFVASQGRWWSDLAVALQLHLAARGAETKE